MALSEKHKAFVEEYLSCFNVTEAYHRVFQQAKRTSAASSGYKLFRTADVAEAISQRLSETAMTADEVLMRLAEQARGLPARYVAQDGAVNIEHLVADGKTHLLKRIKDTQYGQEYEMYDAQSALKIIGDHHGLFKGNPAENPQHVVTHTHDEWVADREKRQQQAAAALADFDDE